MGEGKLIVIEGVDCSGKTTMYERLKAQFAGNDNYCFISYPKYESETGKLISQYLRGELALTDEERMCLYATDRFVDYLGSWKAKLQEGKTVVAARYTTSTMIYTEAGDPQDKVSKFTVLGGEDKRKVEGLEYGVLGLPKPDAVMLLDVPADVLQQRLTRKAQAEGYDVLEANFAYTLRCAAAARAIASVEGWHVLQMNETTNIDEAYAQFYVAFEKVCKELA